MYDDIDGWNENPYTGTQEFYNDFCNFHVNITVPGNFAVWCTGDLVNAKEVLSDTCFKRLQRAETQDAAITIIDSSNIANNNFTKQANSLTWQFDANDVTDVAFAVSNHYLWQSASLIVDSLTRRKTRVDAVFNPKHKDYFDVLSFARKTVEAMSFTIPAWPFPYAHETIFDGLDQMEYPMMVNDNPLADRDAAIELTDHEIFHTMFPFYMGINETKYAWMDEGWATLGEWLISPLIDSTVVDSYGVEPYATAAGTEEDLPVITLSTEENGTTYFLNSYPKPAFGYLYVKDMLGDKLFIKALHNYISQWHGKHPTPYDFFYSMNKGAGRDMNWFWKQWFIDGGTPDLGIGNIMHQGNRYNITVINKGGKPVPVYLAVFFADGSKKNIHSAAGCWKTSTSASFSFLSGKKIKKITLGSTYTPDTDTSDNIYPKKKR